MNNKSSKTFLWLILIFIFSVQACGPATQPATSTAMPVSSPTQAATATPIPSPTLEPFTATPLATSTASLTATATLPVVTVTAVKGNLFIRRGPDTGFNPISVLMDGQTATVISRDVLAQWVQIPLPNQPDKTGWVSIQTTFSVISGDVMALPDELPNEWPVPAYLRNCTYHNMQIQPGDITLPSLGYYPDNDVRLDPGTYTVYDTEVAGNPEVLTAQISEGSEIDVRVDGNGEKRKCPQ